MEIFDEMICAFSNGLKDAGYKKSRLSWRKRKEQLTVFFAVQKSQYGSDTWYYCFGIAIHALSEKPVTSISGCQIQDRLDQSTNGHVWTPNEIIHLVERWESLYGTIGQLRRKAIEGNIPRMCAPEAISYLTTVDLSRYQ